MTKKNGVDFAFSPAVELGLSRLDGQPLSKDDEDEARSVMSSVKVVLYTADLVSFLCFTPKAAVPPCGCSCVA